MATWKLASPHTVAFIPTGGRMHTPASVGLPYQHRQALTHVVTSHTSVAATSPQSPKQSLRNAVPSHSSVAAPAPQSPRQQSRTAGTASPSQHSFDVDLMQKRGVGMFSPRGRQSVLDTAPQTVASRGKSISPVVSPRANETIADVQRAYESKAIKSPTRTFRITEWPDPQDVIAAVELEVDMKMRNKSPKGSPTSGSFRALHETSLDYPRIGSPPRTTPQGSRIGSPPRSPLSSARSPRLSSQDYSRALVLPHNSDSSLESYLASAWKQGFVPNTSASVSAVSPSAKVAEAYRGEPPQQQLQASDGSPCTLADAPEAVQFRSSGPWQKPPQGRELDEPQDGRSRTLQQSSLVQSSTELSTEIAGRMHKALAKELNSMRAKLPTNPAHSARSWSRNGGTSPSLPNSRNTSRSTSRRRKVSPSHDGQRPPSVGLRPQSGRSSRKSLPRLAGDILAELKASSAATYSSGNSSSSLAAPPPRTGYGNQSRRSLPAVGLPPPRCRSSVAPQRTLSDEERLSQSNSEKSIGSTRATDGSRPTTPSTASRRQPDRDRSSSSSSTSLSQLELPPGHSAETCIGAYPLPSGQFDETGIRPKVSPPSPSLSSSQSMAVMPTVSPPSHDSTYVGSNPRRRTADKHSQDESVTWTLPLTSPLATSSVAPEPAVCHFQADGCTLSCGGQTALGSRKQVCLVLPLSTTRTFFGVFDGYGTHGHDVAAAVSNCFRAAATLFPSPASPSLPAYFAEAFVYADEEAARTGYIKDSGTFATIGVIDCLTGVAALAHVGNALAVVADRSGIKFQLKDYNGESIQGARTSNEGALTDPMITTDIPFTSDSILTIASGVVWQKLKVHEVASISFQSEAKTAAQDVVSKARARWLADGGADGREFSAVVVKGTAPAIGRTC